MNERCGDCRFWKDKKSYPGSDPASGLGGVWGFCCRHAPSPTYSLFLNRARWPLVEMATSTYAPEMESASEPVPADVEMVWHTVIWPLTEEGHGCGEFVSATGLRN